MHLKMIERRESEWRRPPAGPNRSDGGEMERMTECLAGFWVTHSAGLPSSSAMSLSGRAVVQLHLRRLSCDKILGIEVLEMTCVVDSLTIRRLLRFLAPLYVVRLTQH